MTIEVFDKNKNILSSINIMDHYIHDKRGDVLGRALYRVFDEIRFKNKVKDVYDFSVNF